MSLHAAGVSEPGDAYAIADLGPSTYDEAVSPVSGFSPKATLAEYGYMGVRHLDQLAKLTKAPPLRLRPHALELARALSISIDDAQESLVGLLSNHSAEWQNFLGSVGEHSFIKGWTIGDRYD
jgi:hypothetical protein